MYLFIQNNFITVNKQVLIITACGDSLDYKLFEAVQSSCQVKNLVLSAFPSVCTILYKNLSNYIQIVVANYTIFFGIDRDFLHKRFFYHSHKFSKTYPVQSLLIVKFNHPNLHFFAFPVLSNAPQVPLS